MSGHQLFPPYPVSGDEIRAAAEQADVALGALDGLEAPIVDTEHRAVLDAVDGDLAQPLNAAPGQVVEQAELIRVVAHFAKGGVNMFALAVDDFNLNSDDPDARPVSELNAIFAEQQGVDFGVDPDDYEAGDPRHGDGTFEAAVEAEDAALRAALWAEYGRLEANLDAVAAQVGGMLERGPNEADILTMLRAGAFNADATALFPDINFGRDDWEAFAIARIEAGNPQALDMLSDALLSDLLADDDVVDALRGLDLDTIAMPSDLKSDLEVAVSVRLLKDDGLLADGDQPGELYRTWIAMTLETGLDPVEIVERARQEHVDLDTFVPLEDLQMVTESNGRRFFIIEESDGAREIVDLTHLLNGGAPSETERHGKNDDSYRIDDPAILDDGGALAATPEGTMMGVGGFPSVSFGPAGGQIMEMSDHGAGYTMQDIFMLTDDADDPEQALTTIIYEGANPAVDDPNATLDELLRHEAIHSDQWARYNDADFLARYNDAATDMDWWPPHPTRRNPCDNEYEQEAGLEDAGVTCN